MRWSDGCCCSRLFMAADSSLIIYLSDETGVTLSTINVTFVISVCHRWLFPWTLHESIKVQLWNKVCFPQQMPPLGPALGGCAGSTYFMPFAAATPCQPAEGEQAVSQPHPGVSGQLQDVWSVHGKFWWAQPFKGQVHPKREGSVYMYSPPFRWRVGWSFVIHKTARSVAGLSKSRWGVAKAQPGPLIQASLIQYQMKHI